MSVYFDTKSSELHDFRTRGLGPVHEEVAQWVNDLILDLATACEFDREGGYAFPADLRDGIYKLILSHVSQAWPSLTPGFGVDWETDEEGMRLLSELVSALHDHFHAAAHAGWPGADNPLNAATEMHCRMTERCEALIALHPSLTLPPLPPLQQRG